MTVMTLSIEVTKLSKNYGRTEALKGLSFSVAPGSIYGVIGPNGAGKTTTLSILAGLRTPTSGTVRILGVEVRPNHPELMSRIGFFSPQFGMFDYLKGYEILSTCGLMHGLSVAETNRRATDLLELLDLKAAASHFIYQYSQGMQLKLGLACALIHAPEVLFLDEPFGGLDNTSVYRLIVTLRHMVSRGKTVLLTSHDLGQVERVCDHVGVLHEGVLKHEARLSASRTDPQSQQPASNDRAPSLESLLWDVVGVPQVVELSWL
ncbi:MAG: ABC transporter ATP-binding protein [Acidobacteriota bacterium]